MYSIKKQFNKIYTTSNFAINLFNECKLEKKQEYIYFSGLLNYLWQSWNKYWRTFWLAYLMGGKNINNNLIQPITQFQKTKENEVIFYILHLLKKRNKKYGKIKGSFEEPTWGDKNVIENIATVINFPGTEVDLIRYKVFNSISSLGQSLKHFQIVRNATIHTDCYNMGVIRDEIVPFYKISNFKYPTDILLAEELRTKKKAFQYWLEEIIVLLQVI